MTTHTKWAGGHKNTYPVASSKNLSPFVQRLYGMESRIRLCQLVGNIEDDKALIFTKEHIYIPEGIPTPEHEVAHMVEMTNQKRWTQDDLGLSNFSIHKKISPRSFFAAIAREVRVRGIQLHMLAPMNAREQEMDRNYNITQHPYWGDEARTYLPFGRFRSFKDLKDWAGDLREKTFNAWSQERIVHEWTVRLDHIRNWMETSDKKVAA